MYGTSYLGVTRIEQHITDKLYAIKVEVSEPPRKRYTVVRFSQATTSPLILRILGGRLQGDSVCSERRLRSYFLSLPRGK